MKTNKKKNDKTLHADNKREKLIKKYVRFDVLFTRKRKTEIFHDENVFEYLIRDGCD